MARESSLLSDLTSDLTREHWREAKSAGRADRFIRRLHTGCRIVVDPKARAAEDVEFVAPPYVVRQHAAAREAGHRLMDELLTRHKNLASRVFRYTQTVLQEDQQSGCVSEGTRQRFLGSLTEWMQQVGRHRALARTAVSRADQLIMTYGQHLQSRLPQRRDTDPQPVIPVVELVLAHLDAEWDGDEREFLAWSLLGRRSAGEVTDDAVQFFPNRGETVVLRPVSPDSADPPSRRPALDAAQIVGLVDRALAVIARVPPCPDDRRAAG